MVLSCPKWPAMACTFNAFTLLVPSPECISLMMRICWEGSTMTRRASPCSHMRVVTTKTEKCAVRKREYQLS